MADENITDGIINEKTDKQKRGCFYSFFGVIAAVILLLVCVATCSNSEPSSASNAKAYAKTAVEQKLKSPSTADFCSYSEMTATNTSGNTWRVSGYVDASNSFGATVRENWTVTLTITDDGATDVSVYIK